MGNILPNSKPKMSKEDVLSLITGFDLDAYPVRLVGVRGYYKETMGNPVKNDRGIYDDAIFLLTPDGFISYNANTDPSIFKPGVASLKAGGPYLYKRGLHGVSGDHPYMALRQYGRVTVTRDGGTEYTDTAASPFFIDIHKGGFNVTSSLGCQTIYPTQWEGFLATVIDQMERHEQEIIPYVLVEA